MFEQRFWKCRTAVAGIQARMGSRRLPGKSLADVAGKPLIHRVWERVSRARRVSAAVVLTSSDPSDDPLAGYCEEHGIPVRRGPLDDVLARYLDFADEFQPRFIVRVTGDCPLIAPEFIDLQVDALSAYDADFVAPRFPTEGVLPGQGAFSCRALRAAASSKDPRDREHVASFWFARHRAHFRHVLLELDPDLGRDDVRLTVDEAEDLELVRTLFEHFAEVGMDRFMLADVLDWLDLQPNVLAINQGVHDSDATSAAHHQAAEARQSWIGHWPHDGTWTLPHEPDEAAA